MLKFLSYYIFYAIQFTWGLTQNILGFLVFFFIKLKYRDIRSFGYNGTLCSLWKLENSMSLGIFIFLGADNKRLLAHEYGHTIQSLILGPLYLPFIGLPSFVWCNLPYCEKIREEKKYRYDSLYTEKWANHIAKMMMDKDDNR